MRSGSHWRHVIRGVVAFVLIGAVLGVIQYYAGWGSHHHKTTLLLSLIVGAIAGAVTYVRSRADRAARGLGRQLGARLRTPTPESPQIQDDEPVPPQPQLRSVGETGPRQAG